MPQTRKEIQTHCNFADIESLAPESSQTKTIEPFSISATLDFASDTVMLAFPLSSSAMKCNSSLPKSNTRARQLKVTSPVPDDQRTNTITPAEFFQLFKTCRKFDNPCSSDIMFISFVQDFGLKEAIQRATKLRWQYQRPLQALLAMWSESAQNYSVRNAKRKRLSGSPAASRKRSSTA